MVKDVCLAVLLVLLVGTACGGERIIDTVPAIVQTADCLRGDLLMTTLLEDEPVVIRIGEVEVCGQGLRISALYGPSLEAHIQDLQARLAAMTGTGDAR